MPRVASNENEGRHLWEVPADVEVSKELELLERVVAALGDPVLRTFNRSALDIDPEVPITEFGEPYTEQDLVEELSRGYNLSTDLSGFVVAASKSAMIQRNDVE